MNSWMRRPLLLHAICALVMVSASGFTDSEWFDRVSDSPSRVEAGIQRIRELKLKHQVPILHRTRAQAAQIILDELAQNPGAMETALTGIAAGALLGRYPKQDDVKGVRADAIK